MDFDQDRIYYSLQDLQTSSADAAGGQDGGDGGDAAAAANAAAAAQAIRDEDDGDVDLKACRRHFREFLRNYRLGQHGYLYREKLLRMHRRLSRRLNAANRGAGGSSSLNDDADDATNGNAAAAQADAARNANAAHIEVDLAHLGEYDAALLGFLLHQPARILPELEGAASDALQTLLYDMNGRGQGQQQRTGDDILGLGDNDNPDATGDGAAATATNTNSNTSTFSQSIQVLLKGNLKPTPLRQIKSEHMNRLLQCPGIVISTSPVKNRAVRLTVRCHRCLDTQIVYATDGPFGSVRLPPGCHGADAECGRFPYAVVPDQCQFCDQQTLKLQEAPERVPTGEMPRSVLVAVERALVDVAPPGTRVTVLCIPTMFTTNFGGGGGNKGRDNSTKAVYLRVVGMAKDNDAHGQAVTFTPAEEEAFAQLARRSDVYDILSRSIAPNISGSYTVDIKRALTCQLFGGSRKRLPDGVRLRGDINVLLLGDPSMAKSQFLKFVSKVAPVGIYTSGKGSSAAGLTASVVKDAKGEFYLEGGAMVLADGGIVCIDEFDKMRPNDRVAIHEAMEQQTISIAKAGITTVLNSRSSVLAAANPVFGRYDDMRSASENIDLMSTILSRFDCIFLVRDVREEERDRLICQHVMGVHMNSSSRDARANGNGLLAMDGALDGMGNESGPSSSSSSPEAIAENVMLVATSGQGELDVAAMKKYIQYCKKKCTPTLSEEAGEVLTSSYVKIRDDVRRQAIAAAGQSGGAEQDTQAAIPITVRQLEALVRLSESLAKMRLDAEVQSEDVTEALRLFKVSTMAANEADQQMGDGSYAQAGGGVAGGAGLGTSNREEMERTESFLKSRLTVGTMVNKQRLIEEAAGQGFNAVIVTRALSIMASRGELLERNQGRLLKRIK